MSHRFFKGCIGQFNFSLDVYGIKSWADTGHSHSSLVQGSNFESCVWRTVSSHSSHHPQEVLLAQFCLYVDKGGLKPDSFHCDNWRDENVTVLKMVAMPIALAYVVALVRFGNDQILCLQTDATSFKADNHVTNSSYIEMIVCMCDTVNDGKISRYEMM